jgi:ectoine hydroxylase-related dioxygenase (phytanoyl-CoA dioxygenase family)
VGLGFVRLLSKSAESPSAVILHQDISYQYGDNEQYSIFLALSHCHNLNGGLSLYPGTHKMGYLGDAGELDSKVLPSDLFAVCPELNMGDALLMNSNTWHFSEAYTKGQERLMLEAHIIDGQSPYANYPLSGSCDSEWKVEMNPVNREEVSFFKNSRSQRIKQLQSELEK